MKKKLIIFAMFVLVCLDMSANNNFVSQGTPIKLSCSVVRNVGIHGGHKSPVLSPTIIIMDDYMQLPTSLVGYEMLIMSNDEVVLSETVSNTEIDLPEYLDGEYHIVFNGYTYCFYGDITL